MKIDFIQAKIFMSWMSDFFEKKNFKICLK